MKKATLVREAAVLRAALAEHVERIGEAGEAAEAEAAKFFEFWGFYPEEAPEHAPAWARAAKLVEELKEESGYTYAYYRLCDVERMIGAREGAQLPLVTEGTKPWACAHVWLLGGETPHAEPCVAPWVAKTLGFAAAE